MSVTRDLIKPLYVFAAIAILICVGLEAGASWLPQPSGSALGQGQLGIAALWLLDISLLWTLILGALAFVVDRNLLGKLQGIVTLVLSIVIILWGLKTLITDFVLLLIMVALLSSFFGWLVYVPLFAFFNTGQAAEFLGILTLFGSGRADTAGRRAAPLRAAVRNPALVRAVVALGSGALVLARSPAKRSRERDRRPRRDRHLHRRDHLCRHPVDLGDRRDSARNRLGARVIRRAGTA